MRFSSAHDPCRVPLVVFARICHLSCCCALTFSCTGSLIGQCVAEPWLAEVWAELLNIAPDSCEIYLRSFPSLEGCSYRDARRSFPTATVIGYHSASQGSIRVNPPETDLIKVGNFRVCFEPSNLYGSRFADERHWDDIHNRRLYTRSAFAQSGAGDPFWLRSIGMPAIVVPWRASNSCCPFFWTLIGGILP